MTRKFTHLTEDDRLLTVQIFISCRDSDGCDATFDIEWIGDRHDDQILLASLTPRDQVDIERHAQDIADSYGPDAYREWVIDCADAEHDRMKDGD